MPNQGKSQTAIDHLEKRLECLQCSDGSIVKLVEFAHQSPGLIQLRRKIAEALVMVIEENHTIEPIS